MDRNSRPARRNWRPSPRAPLDVETATNQALAQIHRFREVLAHGSIIDQKEFLRGMIAEIVLYPSKNRGVVKYYDLLLASFKCHGGTGAELEKMQSWPAWERIFWSPKRWIEAAQPTGTRPVTPVKPLARRERSPRLAYRVVPSPLGCPKVLRQAVQKR